MARFYASIQGNRGRATRMGTPNSGINGHIRGWSVGVRVQIRDEDGEDVAYVYLTSGSNGNSQDKYIGTYRIADLEADAE